MPYAEKAWKKHNGRNPKHRFGQPSHWLGERSRWLPHVGGASCGPRIAQPAVSRMTRQQDRRAQIKAARRVARARNLAGRPSWQKVRADWRVDGRELV